jgi:hypothetical protein
MSRAIEYSRTSTVGLPALFLYVRGFAPHLLQNAIAVALE